MISIEAAEHGQLAPGSVGQLRALFDAGYLQDFGRWDPEQPYGYAPHGMHFIAYEDGTAIGHAGWAIRSIGVGGQDVVIAGVGGVLVARAARGRHLGERLLEAAATAMRDEASIHFGYLGCREEVAGFYRRCGWHRITAAERSIARDGTWSEDPAGQPLLILPVHRRVSDWPAGMIDLRGRAW